MLQFVVELKEEVSPAMSKLRHDRVEAIERKKPMLVKKIDVQIGKLMELEKLQKEKDIAWEQLEHTDDFAGAKKLREQLKHAQIEYDAEYKSVTADDTKN